MTRPALRALTAPLCLLALCAPPPAVALDYRLPLVMDELASPFTESEVGGIGCLVASIAVGGAITYLLGGVRSVVTTLATPMPPTRVLEGSAAAAFVFSSACYIGVALAPLAMLTYTSIVDNFAYGPAPAPVIVPSNTVTTPVPSTPAAEGAANPLVP